MTNDEILGSSTHMNRSEFYGDQLSGLWPLVEEVVHDANDIDFVGTEDVVVGVS
jgi:hypothetical protein